MSDTPSEAAAIGSTELAYAMRELFGQGQKGWQDFKAGDTGKTLARCKLHPFKEEAPTVQQRAVIVAALGALGIAEVPDRQVQKDGDIAISFMDFYRVIRPLMGQGTPDEHLLAAKRPLIAAALEAMATEAAPVSEATQDYAVYRLLFANPATTEPDTWQFHDKGFYERRLTRDQLALFPAMEDVQASASRIIARLQPGETCPHVEENRGMVYVGISEKLHDNMVDVQRRGRALYSTLSAPVAWGKRTEESRQQPVERQ